MKTAILFIHGFIGASRQFKTLASMLSDCGVDIFLQVLPGHEASLEAFRATGAGDWQESVNQRLFSLSQDYERVVLVGHSMGGLLAVCAACAYPEKVAGVVAIGFPLKISLRPQWIKLNIAAAGPRKENEDPRITAARSMSGVKIRSAGQYFSTLPQNMQFLKTTRITRKKLSGLKAPLALIHFEHDEIVSRRTPALVQKKLPEARVFRLPKSYHFLFDPSEEALIAGVIQKFAAGSAPGRNESPIGTDR